MRFAVSQFLALFIATLTSPSFAAWPNSSLVNLPVAAVSFSQERPTMVSDGAGGAIVAWQDGRSGAHDIYGQRVLAAGVVDPAWPVNGRALCTAVAGQYQPAITTDGEGGAIVAWYDNRNGDPDIYAQRILATGIVDPAWPANGRALCSAANTQFSPQIVPDGTGGAIVTWYDLRNGANYDIYAQRVFATGVVDPTWPANGRAVCTTAGNQVVPQITSDGVGGAFIAWHDDRSGASSDIYAHRILASGAVDPVWPTHGREICTAAGTQELPQIASDGAGGAIIVWHDYRGGDADIYAHRILSLGVGVHPWPVDGLALCTAVDAQVDAQIASDGSGGTVVTWRDFRSGTSSDIYAQRVLTTGTVDPAWPASGFALCTALNDQQSPAIASDRSGSVVVAWSDGRLGQEDIYAHRILVSGALDASWPIDGRAVSTTFGEQMTPRLVADDSGGAIVSWMDSRHLNTDVYAQRIAPFGYLGNPEPVIASVADVPYDQGGKLKLSWQASYLEPEPYLSIAQYRIFRSVPPNVAADLIARGAPIARATDLELLERPGDLYATTSGSTTYYWEFVASVSSDFLSNYSYVVPTGQDSTAAGAPETALMVQARGFDVEHWESLPVLGYSVDDLAPATPGALTGQFGAGTTRLHWNQNSELDFAAYRIYRGASESFTPAADNLIATVPDTGYADPAGSVYWYKLSAVDSHDNESLAGTLYPTLTTGVGESPALRAYLSLVGGNPVRGSTSLRFGLVETSAVRLELFDAIGRRVRTLARGTFDAGDHTVSWDRRDDGGKRVTQGLYFVRFDTPRFCDTRRVVVAE